MLRGRVGRGDDPDHDSTARHDDIIEVARPREKMRGTPGNSCPKNRDTESSKKTAVSSPQISRPKNLGHRICSQIPEIGGPYPS